MARRWKSIVALSLLAVVGCQKASDRLEVSGTVTLDGTPLDDGSIRFTSLSEKKFASGALVMNGEYLIPQEKGLPPGKYHLEITAPDANAKPIRYRTGPNDPGVLTQPERIPAEYNVDSKQSVDIAADGENHFAFDIVSTARAGK